MKIFSNLSAIFLIIIILSSCTKLEMIPFEDEHNVEINDRFYHFKSETKFGEKPPTSIKVDKSQKQTSKSYIKQLTTTKYVKFKNITEGVWIIKTLIWLGLIAVILISAFGFFLIKPTNNQNQKTKNLIRILVSQIPLLVFLYFVNYPALYIFLFITIIVVGLIVGSSTEFKKKHLFTLPIALLMLAWCGYKAGSKVYIDNASNNNVQITLNGKSSCILPAKSYTVVRISEVNSPIKVTLDNNLIEEIKLPIINYSNSILKQAFFPWVKHIYNIQSINNYEIKNIIYQ